MTYLLAEPNVFLVRNSPPGPPTAGWPHREFFTYLTELRNMAGFKNWREFSWASSVTEATFSKWKSGENKPSRESLQLVVAALRNAGLDTSIQALEVRAGLATDPIGEEAPKTVPPQIAKLLAIWDRSPTQEFRNELIGYVENVSELFAAKLEKLEAAADYRSLSA